MQWYLVAALLTILTSSQGILTTLSQSNGKYNYDYATIPFLAELFKLSVSGFFLWKECHSSSPPRMTKEWRSVRLYVVPSVIYLIHNNVQFATLTYVDPSTYQIMGNLKIVTTGILFRCAICLLTEMLILLCLTPFHDRIPISFPIMLCTMP
ncbi:CMP-sialic acid transporter 1 [Zea mays]|uniref:CMP-sialic acid transporter 1 n=1 Tax=Zea mays TaxID=4577 RepID=A0A1D6P0S9_MAIZE|nr:CMP-sialic acid transporter 1 [Zea mays]